MLDTIPGEIATIIIDELDQSSLFSLLRCSKLWHKTVLPRLYRNLELRRVRICKFRDCTGTRRPGYSVAPDLHNLVSRLLHNPSLASCVRTVKPKPKTVYIRFNLDRHENSVPTSPNQVEAHINLARQSPVYRYSAKDFEVEEEKLRPMPWILERLVPTDEVDAKLQELVEMACSATSSMSSSDWLRDATVTFLLDALLACLYLLLPCLNHLDLGFSLETKYLNCILRTLVKNKTSPSVGLFQSLISVCHDSGGSYFKGYTPQLISWLFLVPSLEVLKGGLDCSSDWNSLQLEPASSNVTSLELINLGDRQLLPTNLEEIVRACRALKSFKIHWQVLNLGGECLDFSRMYSALLFTTQSLEELSLSYEDISYWRLIYNDNFDYFKDPIPSLLNFNKLSKLSIGLAFITGCTLWLLQYRNLKRPLDIKRFIPLAGNLSAIPPPNIKSLRVVKSSDERLAPALMGIENVLTNAKEKFPRLTRIKLRRSSFLYNEGSDATEDHDDL